MSQKESLHEVDSHAEYLVNRGSWSYYVNSLGKNIPVDICYEENYRKRFRYIGVPSEEIPLIAMQSLETSDGTFRIDKDGNIYKDPKIVERRVLAFLQGFGIAAYEANDYKTFDSVKKVMELVDPKEPA